jgi:hypothetical protein
MKKDFEGAVNAFIPKIAELEGAPHEIVEKMDEWKAKISEITKDADLSGEGKAKRLSELKQKIDEEMAQLDATFDRDFGNIDGALAHLQNERNTDEPDLPEPPSELRFSGEKLIWHQNATLERQLSKLEKVLTTQHRQSLLKDELQNMTADEIVRRADWAWKVGDQTAMEIFARFGKTRLAELGNVEATASLGKILNEYEESLIPKHAKNAVKMRARLAKARSEWRVRLGLVKQNLR